MTEVEDFQFCKEGNKLVDEMKFQEAFDMFSKEIEIHPNYLDSYFFRGRCLFELGRYKEAALDYEMCLKFEDLSLKRKRTCFANAGVSRMQLKEFEKAKELYDEGLELFPNSSEFYSSRGVIFRQLGRHDLALEDYSKALEINPNDGSAFINRGTLHNMNGRSELAIIDFTRGIELCPNHTSGYYLRGFLLDKLERYEEALEDFRQVIRIDTEKKLKKGLDNTAANQVIDERWNKLLTEWNQIARENDDGKRLLFIQTNSMVAGMFIGRSRQVNFFNKVSALTTVVFLKKMVYQPDLDRLWKEAEAYVSSLNTRWGSFQIDYRFTFTIDPGTFGTTPKIQRGVEMKGGINDPKYERIIRRLVRPAFEKESLEEWKKMKEEENIELEILKIGENHNYRGYVMKAESGEGYIPTGPGTRCIKGEKRTSYYSGIWKDGRLEYGNCEILLREDDDVKYRGSSSSGCLKTDENGKNQEKTEYGIRSSSYRGAFDTSNLNFQGLGTLVCPDPKGIFFGNWEESVLKVGSFYDPDKSGHFEGYFGGWPGSGWKERSKGVWKMPDEVDAALMITGWIGEPETNKGIDLFIRLCVEKRRAKISSLGEVEVVEKIGSSKQTCVTCPFDYLILTTSSSGLFKMKLKGDEWRVSDSSFLVKKFIVVEDDPDSIFPKLWSEMFHDERKELILKKLEETNRFVFPFTQFSDPEKREYIFMLPPQELDLSSLLEKFEEGKLFRCAEDLIIIFSQLLEGIQCMHRNGVIHRDINPKNIFISTNPEPICKIGCFGSEIIFSEEGMKIPYETVRHWKGGNEKYTPPEIKNCAENKLVADYSKYDVYSAGILFYQLMFGKDSYPVYDENQQFKASENEYGGKFVFMNSMLALIQKMVELDVQKRCNLEFALDEVKKIKDSGSLYFSLHGWKEKSAFRMFKD